jgi:signal peptidase I
MTQVAQLFDSKLRNARKTAKIRVKEAKKLLRRARRVVSTDVQNEVAVGVGEVAAALQDGNVSQINKSSDRLGALVSKHLDAYRKPAWRESIESIAVAILVALLLRSFVVEAFKIPSGSMIPTLAIGDQIFVNKYIYGVRIPFTSIRLVDFAMPERGEVIVFRCPRPPYDDYIKRVIGLPGDEIVVRDGVIHVNGEPVPRKLLGRRAYWDREADDWRSFEAFAYEEKLGEHSYLVLQDAGHGQSAPDYGPTIVPEGHVFMMGDNRDRSFDSRAWGPVPLPNILGRSLFVWWSWGREGLDTNRLGTWIE